MWSSLTTCNSPSPRCITNHLDSREYTLAQPSRPQICLETSPSLTFRAVFLSACLSSLSITSLALHQSNHSRLRGCTRAQSWILTTISSSLSPFALSPSSSPLDPVLIPSFPKATSLSFSHFSAYSFSLFSYCFFSFASILHCFPLHSVTLSMPHTCSRPSLCTPVLSNSHISPAMHFSLPSLLSPKEQRDREAELDAQWLFLYSLSQNTDDSWRNTRTAHSFLLSKLVIAKLSYLTHSRVVCITGTWTTNNGALVATVIHTRTNRQLHLTLIRNNNAQIIFFRACEHSLIHCNLLVTHCTQSFIHSLQPFMHTQAGRQLQRPRIKSSKLTFTHTRLERVIISQPSINVTLIILITDEHKHTRREV